MVNRKLHYLSALIIGAAVLESHRRYSSVSKIRTVYGIVSEKGEKAFDIDSALVVVRGGNFRKFKPRAASSTLNQPAIR